MSSVRPIFSSPNFVLTLSPNKLYTDHTNHAMVSPKI
jgi:hypothetical protein